MDEMEYVDGGRETNYFWWGFASNLNTDECKDMAFHFTRLAIGYGVVVDTYAAIAAYLYAPVGLVVGILSIIQIANFSWVANDLSRAGDRNGGTLSMLKSGQAKVDIW
ncbi:hypothetical protein D3C81_1660490 [compost metagenome]